MSFDWNLFWIILIFTAPGILIAGWRIVDALAHKIRESSRGKEPNLAVIKILGIVQSLVFAASATAAGVWLAPKINFGAPFF